jgi:predicted MFS family arabinose efflux permease
MSSAEPARRRQAIAALVVLFVVALFNFIDRSLISILQVPIKRELGLSDGQLGAITGLSFALFYATAALPIARLVDRGRRTAIMAAALVVWTLMTALTSLAHSFGALVVFRVGVALGEAGTAPATQSLLSDFFPAHRRGTVLAIWVLASPVGTMLGLAGSGWLNHVAGWRESFAIMGLAGLLLAPVILLLPEPPRGQLDPPAVGANANTPSLRQAAQILWRTRWFRLMILATTFQTFAYSAVTTWLAPFYVRVHHLPLAAVAAQAALVIGLGGGLGMLAGGVLVDRLGRRDPRWRGWLPAATTLIGAPFCAAFLLAPSAPGSIALAAIALFFASAYVAPVNALAQSLVTPRMRGVTAAVLLLVPTIFGVGLGPYLTGAASDAFAVGFAGAQTSLRYAISAALAPSLLGGGLFWVLGNGFAPQPSPAAAPSQIGDADAARP